MLHIFLFNVAQPAFKNTHFV